MSTRDTLAHTLKHTRTDDHVTEHRRPRCRQLFLGHCHIGTRIVPGCRRWVGPAQFFVAHNIPGRAGVVSEPAKESCRDPLDRYVGSRLGIG